MKFEEVLEFCGKTFKFNERKGNKIIYASQDNIYLEINKENGIIKKINWLEDIENNKPNKKIKITVRSNNKVEISIIYNDYKKLEINHRLYQNFLLNYVNIYDNKGSLSKQKISLITKNSKNSCILEKISNNKNQYIDNNKTVLTIELEELDKVNEESQKMFNAFSCYLNQIDKISNENNNEIETTEVEEVVNDVLPNYFSPSKLYIYDRSYQLKTSKPNNLEYFNDDDGKYWLNIKLDHENKKIKELIFIQEKPQLDLNKAKSKNSTTVFSIKSLNMRIIPEKINIFKGLLTINGENMEVNGKDYSKKRLVSECYYNHDSRELTSKLELKLKKKKIHTKGTLIFNEYENNKENHHIVSEGYMYFMGLLRLSPYIIKSIEEEIWQKQYKI